MLDRTERQWFLQVVQWKPWQKYVYAHFYEPVRGFGFFFVAARNINIFGHSFILERERGKRVPHDGFNKVFLQAFEYALSQGQESCSLLARESAPVLVRACRRRCEQYCDMQTSENNFKPAGAD